MKTGNIEENDHNKGPQMTIAQALQNDNSQKGKTLNITHEYEKEREKDAHAYGKMKERKENERIASDK